MSGAKSPSSFRGWEAIAVETPHVKGTVVSDERSEYLRGYFLTIDWNEEPPEIVNIHDRTEMVPLTKDGYLLMRSAGRDIAFIPRPLIHNCQGFCDVHANV